MRYLSWDLGPRRPWEDGLIEADQWELAKAVRTEIHKGMEDARSGHEAEQSLQKRLAAMTKGRAQC